ncbi:hypothetical protein [Qingshengfaniella alkalisoli]|uniref:Lipoprotein n=1 Tax=Qingshengfaniella alkalisoli TaxID=2599296 RepID=A0A5B8ITD4_9RHOB|nr:hypothetical protein [Qingshengfaniella alkalisoli]QDY68904.1 hypothetical protein FPZ52_04150 [Qingshengfaniella alkalisoli]
MTVSALRLTIPAAAMLVLVGCEPPAEVAPVDPAMKMAQMEDACKQAAATNFGQSPDNVFVYPAQENAGYYTVPGQYPPRSPVATGFICSFDDTGALTSVTLS